MQVDNQKWERVETESHSIDSLDERVFFFFYYR